jgi:hypothetical protein
MFVMMLVDVGMEMLIVVRMIVMMWMIVGMIMSMHLDRSFGNIATTAVLTHIRKPPKRLIVTLDLGESHG